MYPTKWIIAHRGDPTVAQENTLPAFANAISSGADMIECDVRRTADNIIVLHHDDHISHFLLANMDYATALARSIASGYRIARLEELLVLTKGLIRLDLEFKETGYEEDVLRSVLDCGFEIDNFIVTSFDQLALEHVKAIYREIRTGILTSEPAEGPMLELVEQAASDFVAAEYTTLNETLLARARECGVPLLVWTVNETVMIRRFLAEPSVCGIITDSVRLAVAIRSDSAIGM
jgi:glycerophosphoryl diester phosphodiesterase